jgi:hypothetical protein
LNLLLNIFLYNTWTLQLFTINQTNSNGKYMQQIIKNASLIKRGLEERCLACAN